MSWAHLRRGRILRNDRLHSLFGDRSEELRHVVERGRLRSVRWCDARMREWHLHGMRIRRRLPERRLLLDERRLRPVRRGRPDGLWLGLRHLLGPDAGLRERRVRLYVFELRRGRLLHERRCVPRVFSRQFERLWCELRGVRGLDTGLLGRLLRVRVRELWVR